MCHRAKSALAAHLFAAKAIFELSPALEIMLARFTALDERHRVRDRSRNGRDSLLALFTRARPDALTLSIILFHVLYPCDWLRGHWAVTG